MRVTGEGAKAVVCMNGGQESEVPGTWSASIEWLVGRIAPRFPSLAFAEVRYRVKSWRVLDMCVEDALAAVEAVGADDVLLVGFSMGGAVSISAADDPRVAGVLGLAPWIPDQLDVAPLAGKRLDVLHGSLDRRLPGVPGVAATQSRHGFERARALGVPGTYTLIRGGVHGLALRPRRGALVPLPRASAWAALAAARVAAFAAG
jgi:dienelactone hydrolase